MILIALGSNLPSIFGSPRDTLVAAIQSLENHDVQIERQSRVWLTAPVPVSGQNWFHNQVISVRTTRPAVSLLSCLHSIEGSAGRVRKVKNEARTLDLDLLSYHQTRLDTDEITLPHPRMHERAFVLYPLRDIAPDWRHPETGFTPDEMIEDLPPGQALQALPAAG